MLRILHTGARVPGSAHGGWRDARRFVAAAWTLAALAAVSFAGGASAALAQGLWPRACSSAPIGVNFRTAGYAYKRGGVSCTLSFAVDLHDSIKFVASSGVSARTGNDFDLLGVAWQYR